MNYLDVIDRLGIDHRLPGQSKDVRAGFVGLVCPSCGGRSAKNAGTAYYLGVNVTTGWASCWRCGKHRLLDVLAEASGEPRHLIAGLLKQTDLAAPLPERKRGKLRIPAGVGPLLKPHKEYLQGRGFDPDAIAATWSVGGIGLAGRLAWRLFLPVTYSGEVLSWTTRAIADVPKRYHAASPEEEVIRLKDLLYGEDLAGPAIVLVEGPTDAWAIGPGAVATCGIGGTMAISREQLRRAIRHPVRAVCFDNEPAAQIRARQVVAELSLWPGKTFLIELEADDPGSASRREIRLLRKGVGLD
jgi:hypothetical protein